MGCLPPTPRLQERRAAAAAPLKSAGALRPVGRPPSWQTRRTHARCDLENFFLTGGLEIAAHRSLQSLGVLVAQVLETCQLVNAPLVRLGRVRIEVCFLFVKDFLE